MRVDLSPVLVCAASLLAACGSPTDSRPDPVPPTPPTAVSLAGGNGQTGIVGGALGDSLSVRVVDAGGRGVAGVEVRFATAAGSASPAVDSTDANGVASTRWTLGEAIGAAGLTATVPVLPGAEVAFTATAARVRPSVAAGLTMSCAITSHGRAFCWGTNGSGELGIGGGPAKLTPVPVATDLRFWSISAGAQHACGIAVDRRAYCWGSNTNGQLGDSTIIDRTAPWPVRGGLRFRTISAGGLHTCGIATNGDTYCWGDGRNGQVGDATNPALVFSPRRVPSPVAFDSLTAGGASTCALTADGVAYCWGYNALGQLGNGTNISVSSPVPVAGGHRFATLRAGMSLTCGTEAGSGRAWCWGNDDWTALGSAVPSETCLLGAELEFVHQCAKTPVPVDDPAGYRVVTPGDIHSCGMAGVQVFCWGLGLNGVLGTGNTIPSPVPTLVGAYPFVDIDVYYLHTCGITAGSAVYCWGRNDWGRLGNGTLEDRWVPTLVVGGPLE